jgi:hypothetical protein
MADVLGTADARRWAADGTDRKIREAQICQEADVEVAPRSPRLSS